MDRLSDKQHIEWARKVKEKAYFVCQVCGKNDIYLHSHHLNSFDIFLHLRYDINNGVCLCQNCHNLFHSIYGKGRNSKYQWEMFVQSYNLIKKILTKLNEDKNANTNI